MGPCSDSPSQPLLPGPEGCPHSLPARYTGSQLSVQAPRQVTGSSHCMLEVVTASESHRAQGTAQACPGQPRCACVRPVQEDPGGQGGPPEGSGSGRQLGELQCSLPVPDL